MKNKIIIVLVVLLILAFIFRKDLARIFSTVDNNLTEQEVEQNVNDTVEELENIELIDGSVYNESYYADNLTFFEGIANAQYNQLNSNNPDETALFNQLIGLTGAELLGVYKAFGSRVWIPFFGSTINANLFEWYSFQLYSQGIFTSMVYYDEDVCGCDSWWAQCYEAEFMGAIWYKSGLNTNIFADAPHYEDEAEACYTVLIEDPE